MTQVRFNNRPVKLDNLFNDFFNLPTAWPTPAQYSGVPAANIYETSTAYLLELSVPGRNKEDFKINLDKDLLTISFEKAEDNQAEGVTTIRKEFTVKNFKRSFTLDEKVDVNNIQAKYENGILKVELAKKAEAKQEPKQITIS
jgi:HSP20 family protein